MPNQFVHLHVHTEYSILDGASKLDDLIAAAVADNQPALGITDHGNMYGVLDFYRKCKKAGIKPIIGTEAYMAKESRHERPPRRGKVDDDYGGETDSGDKVLYHITLLAADNVGYKNLIQVSSKAFLDGYYYKPRCDWEILSEHSKGIIATTGCLGGQVPQALLRGRYDDALQRAARFQDIFGRDNFFVELQDHGIPEQHQIQSQLLEIAEKLKAPLLATNDSHYTNREDSEAHDALLCVQTGSRIDQEDRFKFYADEFYLKTSVEMRKLFKDLEIACDNTLSLAERCDLTIEFGNPQLPHFPLPDKFKDDRDYLEHLTFTGAKKRWGDPIPQKAKDRLAYELKVINDMGFASYFLIVWDLIEYAHRNGIRVGPGRGSAAGCAVAYALRITDLDPIKYGLLFERFLNPSRISMPDIDIDFDSRFRDEMINYVADRYGRDHVAQIITFGTIKARAAVRDAARVLGYPVPLADKISKAMPPLILGRDTPIQYCLEKSDKYRDGYIAAVELRDMVEKNADVAKIVEVAKGIEGLRRQDGIHAAAVVITRNPLTDLVPIQRKSPAGTDPELAPVVTQYEMHGMEDLGLLKMDFLGLRNLDVITDCVKLIQSTRKKEIDIDRVDLFDAKTFDLLCHGDTIGVFQLESPQMRALIRSLQPTDFNDVAALVALYRPGPMAANMHNDYADRKNGRQPIEYIHDDTKEILADTYGLMIYQENVMRIAEKFAGYTLAEADSLRKAMGKKIRAAMAKEKEKFINGVDSNGYPPGLGKQLFGIIEQFADYAFNKSHSYAYGYIAYQTAYLKANFPIEYFAALLSSVRKKLDMSAIYLNECRLHNIAVLVPDVNRSAVDFTPVIHFDAAAIGDTNGAGDARSSSSGSVVYGLSSIRNVASLFAVNVVDEREANGPYQSFVDFMERIDIRLMNKRMLESMVKAGAFDSFGHSRKGLIQVYEQIVDTVVRQRKEREVGVMSLFSMGGESGESNSVALSLAVPEEEYDRMELLALEKRMLGLYVSDHPIAGLEGMIRQKSDATIADLDELSDGDYRSVGGVITQFETRYTRKGELMATFVLEDMTHNIAVMVFPRTMEKITSKLEDEAVAVVSGRVACSGDSRRIFASDIYVFNRHEMEGRPLPLKIKIDARRHSVESMNEMRKMLKQHPGSSSVQLHIEYGHFGSDRKVANLSDEFTVDTKKGLVGELKVLLGKDAIIAA